MIFILQQVIIFVGITESYPGTPLREGSTGADVALMQRYLNRIRVNYPLIPQISNPNGIFTADTTKAVQTFQSIFNLTQDGIIGRATWFKIVQLYVGITKLASLDSEGERIGIGAVPPTIVLREGSTGPYVIELQFLLNYIGTFYSTIPPVIQDNRWRLEALKLQQLKTRNMGKHCLYKGYKDKLIYKY